MAAALFCWSVRSLLRHLTADLAARIGRGVDVDVELAAEQIGGLRVGQCRRALGRAGGSAWNRNRNAGVLAGLGRSVGMRGGGGGGPGGKSEPSGHLFCWGGLVP